MDFDNCFSFFESHSILAEKQQTKQTNYSYLSFSASLDTQNTFQGGIIVEWKKFWQEIPVCLSWASVSEFIFFKSFVLSNFSFVFVLHFKGKPNLTSLS